MKNPEDESVVGDIYPQGRVGNFVLSLYLSSASGVALGAGIGLIEQTPLYGSLTLPYTLTFSIGAAYVSIKAMEKVLYPDPEQD
jgi:hypothetical protein